MTETAFALDWVSPPGETIADVLDERGWTQAELAELATRISSAKAAVDAARKAGLPEATIDLLLKEQQTLERQRAAKRPLGARLDQAKAAVARCEFALTKAKASVELANQRSSD